MKFDFHILTTILFLPRGENRTGNKQHGQAKRPPCVNLQTSFEKYMAFESPQELQETKPREYIETKGFRAVENLWHIPLHMINLKAPFFLFVRYFML